jgi:phosphatidylinositol alpha-1,6-mannosyltransferase
VTNDLPPRAGGIEQFVGNLLDRQPPGQAVVVGPANPDAAAHDASVPWRVVRAPGAVLPTPAVLRLVRRVAAEHRPDVVVLGASWPLGELAAGLGRDPGVPVVALSHGLEAGLTDRGLGLLVRRTTRHLAALTTISDWTEQRLAPHARCRVVRVPPGVDVARFRPDVDGTALRDAWGVPRDAPLVGCVSRLVPRKGQDALLDAWPVLAARHPDAWLVLVGTGPLEQELRTTAAALPRVVVPGAVAWDDLPAAHAALDVFAMPCRTRLLGTDVEGLGIVYLEAQASGVPVVAGSSGGAPETLVEGRTGTVVDGRDVPGLTAAIDGLLADPARRAAWGTAGRAHAEATWGWEAIAARFAGVLAAAVDGRPTDGQRRPDHQPGES